MAGSYGHVLEGWSLIENMGDAHEAVEELMWLVQSQIGTEQKSAGAGRPAEATVGPRELLVSALRKAAADADNARDDVRDN